MKANRLALGTAQVGMHYGIANQDGIPSDEALSLILELAQKNGTDMIDTAAAYGNAEQRLGETGLSGFNVVSKFPPQGQPGLHLEESLKKLRLERLYGFIAHNVEDLLRDETAWNSLLTAKEKGKAERIGFSLYSPQQLERCLSKGFVPDLVQFPYSLLDRRFEPYFDGLKKMGCEIHTRSTFLQGLYFLGQSNIPERLKELAAPLFQLHELATQNNLSTEELALAFVLSDSRIDYVVVGVESVQQLQSNLTAVEKMLSDEIKHAILSISVMNEDLLNPSKW